MHLSNIARFSFLTLLLFAACTEAKQEAQPVDTTAPPTAFVPDDPELYSNIVGLDSAFFAAYNTCDVNLETYASFYAEDIEFYHDQGGLATSKADIVKGTKENICGKVTRELVPGSIEVYPIRGFGAVEIGFHKFINNEEPAGTPSQPGRFVVIWQQQEDGWKISRVVSLH